MTNCKKKSIQGYRFCAALVFWGLTWVSVIPSMAADSRELVLSGFSEIENDQSLSPPEKECLYAHKIIRMGIDPRDHSRIDDKWVDFGVAKAINWHWVWRIVIILVSGAAIFFTVILLWNRRLSREINERKKAQESLKEVNSLLELILQNSMISISGLVKAEVEMKKAKEEAEIANQAKSDFLARMSHEIRTPLNAVIGLSHLMRKTELSAKQEDLLQKIQSSSHALLVIINDILDFSKMEAGRLTIEKSNFEINNVLMSLSDMISIKAEEKELELIFTMAENVPRALIGDALRLEQILLHLINNAIKFTENGEILLSIETLEQKAETVVLQFSVQDTGIGIAPEKIDTLFNAFSQADSSTTRKYGGSGLGLAICKGLVEIMNGSIAVKSKLGEGSLFSFTAEFGCPRKSQAPHPAFPAAITNLRVLVVDDNPVVQQVLQRILANFSMTVKVLASGAAALAELELAAGGKQDKPYDLVIMDWKMPGMDGIQTSTLIKEKLDLNPIPKIILMTAFDRETVIQRAEKAGIDGFLMKPVTPSQLHDTIMLIFGKQFSKGAVVPLENRSEKTITAAGARILLVEDNEMNQEVARQLLEHAGFLVFVADNGKEAVRLLETLSIDAVLMDLEMPEMDGYACTRFIRESLGRTELPIIAMTAHAIDSERERCLKTGMNDFITKPFDPQHLFTTLVRWIKMDRPLEPVSSAAGRKAVSDIVEASAIPDIQGINVSAGLMHCNGSINLFRKLLIKFCQNNLNAEHKIREAIHAGDTEQSRRLAHSLKGVAGNVGAETVFQLAGDLETSLRNKDSISADTQLDALAHALSEILEAIKMSGVTEPQTKEVTMANPKQGAIIERDVLSPVLLQLHGYLKDDNVKAGACAESIGPYLADALEVLPKFRELQAQIGRYDYENALKTLQLISETLNIPLLETS